MTQAAVDSDAEIVVEALGIIKEGDGQNGDPIKATIEHLAGGTGVGNNGNELTLTLTKGEAGRFRATTDSFPDIWAVDLKPVVTFSGKSKKQKKGKAK